MKKVLSLLLLVSCFHAAEGQTIPGYMGKRITISYNPFTTLSLGNPTNSTYPDIDGGWAFQHYFTVDYVLTKKISLIANVHTAKSFFVPQELRGLYNSQSDLYIDYLLEEYPEMNSTGVDVGVRFYRKHLAPLGAYFELRAGLTRIKIPDVEYQRTSYVFVGSNQIVTANEPYIVEGSGSLNPMLGMAFGTNRVIADKFVLSYGLDFAFYANGNGFKFTRGLWEGSEYISFSYYDEQQLLTSERILEFAEGRYTIQAIYNFRLGIGYLL